MADLGNTSQAHTAHKHKTTSWITVALIIVASVILALALVFQSMVLAILGGVVGVVGLVMAFAYNIMEDAH